MSAVSLSERERDEFLGAGGVGVLSLSTTESEPPHTLPVSYGYDAETESFYFRLAVGPNRAKGPVKDRLVSFVAYGDTDEETGWWSVLATGTLEDIEDADDALDALDGLQNVHIPLVDVFGVPPKEVSYQFVRLVPETLETLKESSTAP
jgi:nitroimidazol reductase NimA-like FMN-containing flavoprotein (pyridoxamine 5'-phosphate oxidase superfamily)